MERKAGNTSLPRSPAVNRKAGVMRRKRQHKEKGILLGHVFQVQKTLECKRTQAK